MSEARAIAQDAAPLALASTAPPTPRAREFSDRVNPVLVKELRAALRGRYFRILFPITLGLATVISLVVLVDLAGASNDHQGREFFQTAFGCLCVALFGFVPFSAFLTMGNEWDEHTYDLLVISNLRPRHIVLGKLLSVGVEALLYAAAFAPFLVFAFLLRGVDIRTIAILLGCSLVTSFACSAIALGLSSLSRVRVVRALLMALLGGILVAAIGFSFPFTDMLVRNPASFTRIEQWIGLVLGVAGILAPAALALALATSMLAHAQENASTVPRAVVSFLLVLGAALTIWLQSEARDNDIPWGFGVSAVLFASLCDLFFVTEPETLAVHVRRRVPKSRWKALFAAPFLPGGGRGWLLYLAHLGFVVGIVSVLALQVRGSWRPSEPPPPLGVLVFGGYFAVYLGLPAWIASAHAQRTRVRIVTRALVPIVILVSLFVPALLGFLLEVRGWRNMEHPFDPFWVSSTRHGNAELVQIGALIVAACVVLANLPRAWRSLAEVRRASDEREEHDAARAALRGGAHAE